MDSILNYSKKVFIFLVSQFQVVIFGHFFQGFIDVNYEVTKTKVISTNPRFVKIYVKSVLISL